jgi:hypothetical protein
MKNPTQPASESPADGGPGAACIPHPANDGVGPVQFAASARALAMQAQCPTCGAAALSVCVDIATQSGRPAPHHSRYFAGGATPPTDDGART